MTSTNPRSGSDREVTLVDLAAILVQRRLVFVLTFLVVVALGVAYALTTPEKYEYVSLVQMAEDSEGQPVESASSSIVAIESYWFPAVEARYQEEAGKLLPFPVSASSPRNTSLIRIESLARRDYSELVNEVHSDLIDELTAAQNEKLQSIRGRLERQLRATDQILEELRAEDGQGQAVAEAVGQKVELEGQLERQSSSVVIATARESVRKMKPNVPLIVMVSVALGVVLAMIAAFLAEFGSLVRTRLRD